MSEGPDGFCAALGCRFGLSLWAWAKRNRVFMVSALRGVANLSQEGNCARWIGPFFGGVSGGWADERFMGKLAEGHASPLGV